MVSEGSLPGQEKGTDDDVNNNPLLSPALGKPLFSQQLCWVIPSY